MNSRFFLVLFCIVGFSTSSVRAQPINIIFDTDMESDVDDVGALAMLHSLADQGEADILATMVSSLNPWAVTTVDALNTYFGRPDIPLGAVKTFGVYRQSRYAQTISEEYPGSMRSGDDAPDAVSAYRQVLSRQPDQSVVIVTIGYLSNLSNLLKSSPDEESPLSGSELVEQKVKQVVIMGGRYPYHRNYEKWGNFKPDPGAVRNVAKQWPTPIIFTGGGDFANLFKTGKKVFSFESASNPVSRAYDIFLEGEEETHHSADLIAVYVAVRGWEEFFQLNRKGYNHIFPDGTLMWRLQPNDTRHSYIDNLQQDVDPRRVVEVFDNLIVRSISKKLSGN